MRESKIGQCALCKREEQLTNFHHYIPRTLHSNKWFKKNFDVEYMRTHGDMMCKKNCHKQIHVLIEEKELGKNYNTIEKLLSHPQVQSYVKWIRKQK